MKEENINQEELLRFKKDVHDPVLPRIFDRTKLNDGTVFIDFMQISYLDGRNSGYDQRIYVSGLECRDGEVSRYENEKYDITVKEFMEDIKEIPFVFDGDLFIQDENRTINLKTKFCASDYVEPLFPEVIDIQPMNRSIMNLEYEKMKFLYSETEEQSQEENEEIEIGGMQL